MFLKEMNFKMFSAELLRLNEISYIVFSNTCTKPYSQYSPCLPGAMGFRHCAPFFSQGANNEIDRLHLRDQWLC